MRAAPKMHPDGVRQDRRGPIRTRYPDARPPFRPGGESGRVLWGDRILFNPVPRCDRRIVAAPGCGSPALGGRGAVPWALECHHVVVKTRTRWFAGGVVKAPSRGATRHARGFDDRTCHKNVRPRSTRRHNGPGFAGDTASVQPRAVFIATRRAPGCSSPQRGGTPKPRVRCPHAARCGGRTLGMRAARKMHPDGVRQDRRGPIRPRHRTHGPHFDAGTNRAVIRRAPHFVQPRWGCDCDSSPPQGAAPWPSGAVEPYPGLWSTTTLW